MTWGMKLEGTYNFDFLKDPPGKQAMRLIGETVKSRIQVETQDLSKDKNGRRFKPYSKLYAKVRKAAGRGTKVDMTDTGNIEFWVDDNRVCTLAASALTSSMLMQPVFYIQKDSGTGTQSMTIDYWSIEQGRL